MENLSPKEGWMWKDRTRGLASNLGLPSHPQPDDFTSVFLRVLG